jgi:hypothetical protein
MPSHTTCLIHVDGLNGLAHAEYGGMVLVLWLRVEFVHMHACV